MDLLPKPDQVVSAASNVAHQLGRGGLADLRPMPRTLLGEGELRRVHRYLPAASVPAAGDPVLLVPPPAAPASCFDLRRGCSLAEHLVGQGRPTYLVEYGEVAFPDRDLTLAPWVDDVLPQAIAEVSADAEGRPVHVVGWSLGGIFALLSAADRPDLPIASITVLGAPSDLSLVPMTAPPRPLLDTDDGLVGRTYRTVGAIPAPLLGWALQLPAFQRLVTRPLAMAVHLDDRDYLAQLEAVDRLVGQMAAYPGRSFGQLYHRFLPGNALAEGATELGGRTVALSAVTAPVLVVAGATDGIAPVPAVRATLPHLTGAREARFEIVPGGHLGMLTGRAARAGTWPVLDAWFEEWSAPAPAPSARKASPRKASAKASARKRAAAKKAAPLSEAASKDTIGSNADRRYGSGGSRALSR